MASRSPMDALRSVPARGWLLLGFMALSAAAAIFAYLQGWLRREMIEEAVAASGPWGMLAFVVAVTALEMLWMPRAWGLVAGGVLFGPLLGGALSFVADMASAIVCYALGRSGGRKWVAGMLAQRPKVARITTLLTRKRGILTVAVLRVIPVAHYTAVSYAVGLAGVGFVHFLLGNVLGLLPYAALYPFVGHSALDPGSPAFILSMALMALAFALSAVLARAIFREASNGSDREDGDASQSKEGEPSDE